MSIPAPQRVSQLDAQRLDEELVSLFQDSTQTILRHFPSSITQQHLPTIKTLLRFFFFSNTLLLNRPTPGSAIYNIHHVTPDSNRLPVSTRALFFLLDVLIPHLANRSQDFQDPRVRHWLGVADAALKVASCLNLIVFLRNGHYRSVTERLLRIRHAYMSGVPTRAPTFEYINSQLVWQGVAEFALVVGPMLAVIKDWIGGGEVVGRILGGLGIGKRRRVSVEEAGERCGVCGQGEMRMKHRVVPCGCVFCWACVAGRRGGCAGCGGSVGGVERVVYG